MIGKPTGRAQVDGLRFARSAIYAAALTALLGTVMCWNLNELSARPFEFVVEAEGEFAPSGVQDTAGQAPANLRHPGRVQFFDHHRTVAVGVAATDFMNNVGALTADFSVDLSDADSGFFVASGSFLSTGKNALGSGQLSERIFQRSQTWNNVSIAVGDYVDHTAVKGHAWLSAWDGIGDFHLNDDTGEPLVNLTDERACLGLAFERTVNDGPHPAEFGEAELTIGKAPLSWLRLTETDLVVVLSLPLRLSQDLLKEVTPSQIKPLNKIGAYIVRHTGEPRQIGPQRSQLFVLVECRVVLPLAHWPCQSEQSLLMSQVPQESQRVPPLLQASNLSGAWVDAISVGFVDLHCHTICLSDPSGISRSTFWPAASASLMNRRVVNACLKTSVVVDPKPEARDFAQSTKSVGRFIVTLVRMRINSIQSTGNICGDCVEVKRETTGRTRS